MSSNSIFLTHSLPTKSSRIQLTVIQQQRSVRVALELSKNSEATVQVRADSERQVMVTYMGFLQKRESALHSTISDPEFNMTGNMTGSIVVLRASVRPQSGERCISCLFIIICLTIEAEEYVLTTLLVFAASVFCIILSVQTSRRSSTLMLSFP